MNRGSLLLVVVVAGVSTAAMAHGASPRRSAASALRVRVAGSAQVGRVLRAQVRPRTRAGFRWQRCDWVGSPCRTVARTQRYRARLADVGRRLVARAIVGRRSARSPPTAIVVPRSGPTIAVAGDIACDPAKNAVSPAECHQAVVGDVAARSHATAVLPLGDEQYECGRADEFSRGYAPTWGRLRALSHPVIGNHEYGTDCAVNDPTPYFSYFGRTAGATGKGWYSYDLGAWHLIALNSECWYGAGKWYLGGCGAGSAEDKWLRADLARHRNRCTIAYWHEPRFSSSEAGDAQAVAQLWNDLVAAHVDVVLSAHSHVYERFDPLGAAPGQPGSPQPLNFQQPVPDPNGIREFVVGTGGRSHHNFPVPPMTGEVVRNSDTFGVLTMRLRRGAYSWRFVPEPGKTFTDSGTATCR